MIEVLSNPEFKIGTDWMRSVLLYGGEPDLEYMRKEYAQTDIFVLEIASMLAYELDGVFFHHIAYDEPTIAKLFPGIIKKTLTLEELANDIATIRDSICPRPLLVVSHIYTYEAGSRWRLALDLKDICQNLDVMFIDPMSFLDRGPLELAVVSEKVISHLTPAGHSLMGDAYASRIHKAISLVNAPTLIQVFPPKVNEEAFHGFGDFIHGAARIFELSEQAGFAAGVSYSGTAFTHWLWNRTSTPHENRQNLARLYHSQNADSTFLDAKYVFTNQRAQLPWSTKTREWVVNECLRARPTLEEAITSRRRELSIENCLFDVIHVRLGDRYTVDHEQVPVLLQDSVKVEIHKILNIKRQKYVILGDARWLVLKILGLPFEEQLGTTHVGLVQNDKEIIGDALIDFFLMRDARHIHSLSTYSWGSSFCSTAAMAFQIPYTEIQI